MSCSTKEPTGKDSALKRKSKAFEKAFSDDKSLEIMIDSSKVVMFKEGALVLGGDSTVKPGKLWWGRYVRAGKKGDDLVEESLNMGYWVRLKDLYPVIDKLSRFFYTDLDEAHCVKKSFFGGLKAKIKSEYSSCNFTPTTAVFSAKEVKEIKKYGVALLG
jgi:hypothetical protein